MKRQIGKQRKAEKTKKQKNNNITVSLNKDNGLLRNRTKWKNKITSAPILSQFKMDSSKNPG